MKGYCLFLCILILIVAGCRKCEHPDAVNYEKRLKKDEPCIFPRDEMFGEYKVYIKEYTHPHAGGIDTSTYFYIRVNRPPSSCTVDNSDLEYFEVIELYTSGYFHNYYHCVRLSGYDFTFTENEYFAGAAFTGGGTIKNDVLTITGTVHTQSYGDQKLILRGNKIEPL